jgi:(4-(4-[2-(gamma-L-glutamylamino)ethyl]phenoxymethyl)furan-2-yl)methanamine synthase
MASGPERRPRVVGWDVGGAHVKACLLESGRVVDVAQWPCPLWKGLAHLDEAIAAARARWPRAWDATTRHAATMTGEMVDLFVDREQGVARLAAALAESLGPSLRLYAGAARFVLAHEAPRHWHAIASANWQATGAVLAPRAGDALLLDVGSTTTDVIPLRGGRVASQGLDDARRLACGELVYQGVVRTPLCALAARVPFEGDLVNVMNEFFATTADVYRTTGELDPAHDQDATADGNAKDLPGTSRRLARMIGRDARDRGQPAWLALAQAWRALQVADIEGQVARVAAAAGLADDAPVVGAGCGAFLAADIARRAGRRFDRFSDLTAGTASAELAGWVDVCAPAAAVAALAFAEA